MFVFVCIFNVTLTNVYSCTKTHYVSGKEEKKIEKKQGRGNKIRRVDSKHQNREATDTEIDNINCSLN